jgi:hypothetical protein
MAIKPSPDRSDLESKTREDLQTIAKVKGVDAPARASKAALIEAIMGEPSDAAPAAASRAVRSRRTVATPVDDFEELLGEFVADAKVPAAATAAPAASETTDNSGGEVLPSERPAARQFTQTRPERQPREFADGSNNRSRRNRRNRNGNGNSGSGN